VLAVKLKPQKKFLMKYILTPQTDSANCLALVLCRNITVTCNFYRQACASARSAAMQVLFLLSSPKIGFSPRRVTFSAINVKFGTYPISRLLGEKCGNTAPKTDIISNFGHKFAPSGEGLSDDTINLINY